MLGNELNPSPKFTYNQDAEKYCVINPIAYANQFLYIPPGATDSRAYALHRKASRHPPRNGS